MQYKFTFVHKVFCYRTVSAHLLSDSFCSNFKRCLVQSKGMRDTPIPQTVSAGKIIAITLEAKKSLMQHTIKTTFNLNL